MPVEIKESVIKVTQRQPDKEKSAKSPSRVNEKEESRFAVPKPADVDIIVDLCAERVFEILREKYER